MTTGGMIMRKLISISVAIGIIMSGMCSCGYRSSKSSANNAQVTTSPNNAQPDTEAAILTIAPQEVETEPKQVELDEAHVEQIMQWIDRSMTTLATSHASALYRALEYSLENIDMEQRKKLDGTYNSDIPAELKAGVNEYYGDITQLKNYSIVIEGGEIKGCWAEVGTWTKEDVLSMSGDYDGKIELWMDMGFTDYEALDEAMNRLSMSYYGSMPKMTCSVYNDMTEKNSGRSNEKPDINNCME